MMLRGVINQKVIENKEMCAKKWIALGIIIVVRQNIELRKVIRQIYNGVNGASIGWIKIL